MPTLNQFEKDSTTYDIEDTTARNKKAVVVNTQKSGAEIGSVDGFKIYSPKITPAATQTSGYEIGSVSVDSAKTTFYAPKVGAHASADADYGNGRRIGSVLIDGVQTDFHLPPEWEKISSKPTTAGWNWVPITWGDYNEIVMLLTGANSNNTAYFHYNTSSSPTVEDQTSGKFIGGATMNGQASIIDVKKIATNACYALIFITNNNNGSTRNDMSASVALETVNGIGFGKEYAKAGGGTWGADVGVGATVTLYGRY